MTKEYFDVIIFAPLDEEVEALFEAFPSRERRTSDSVLKYTIDLGGELTGLMAHPPEWGNQEAYRTTQHILERYETGLLVCIGIAGALSSDLRLGDVCYTGTVFDVHDRLKVKEAKKGKRPRSISLEHNPKVLDTPRRATVALNFLRTDPELKRRLYDPWRKEQAAKRDAVLVGVGIDPINNPNWNSLPVAINGAIICGPVVASSSYGEVLKGIDRKVLCIETESGGLFQAAKDAEIPALTIRGVSDFADSKKSNLEEKSAGAARRIASRNAFAFFKWQLLNPEFREYLREERRKRSGETLPGLLAPVKVNPVVDALAGLASEIQAKLHEYCPELPHAQKGYRLPSPRIKSLRLEDDPRVQQSDAIADLLDALSGSAMIFVDVPRNYPDLALPWVWADALSIGTIEDRQVVPIVVDADNIRPPATFRDAVPKIVTQLEGVEGVQLVFIVDNVDPGSRSRSLHIISELKQFPNARFVFLTKGEGPLLLQREMVRKLNARTYSLCAISFMAMSEFIQAAFEMVAAEAEVIALKLRDTFSKFKLTAHPSYFAGIPRPMLSGLLQANRRAELIQLAVDGYLTVIAGQDEAKSHLNRSTRARYLSLLAVKLEVEKREFTRANLIDFTKEFAATFDFDDLDPLPFITTFVQKGILQFSDDRVEFTLPFVKSYLLAAALRDDPALAKTYFAFAAEDFDFETFDLYSELGPSEAIVEDVENRLQRHVQEMSAAGVSQEFLLSDELRPALLQKSDRLGEIRENIQRAVTRLQERTEDGRGKQKLLDIADNTNAEVEQKVEEKVEGSSAESKNPFGIDTSAIDGLLRDWRIANILLGAAAQRLPGATKQRLAALLATGGAALADRLTRLYASVNFKTVKDKMLNSKEVKSFLSTYSTEKDVEEFRQLIGYLIDFVELYVLALPVRSVLADLCDQSGDKVLSGSVGRAKVPQGLPAIIHATWLADLDSQKAMPGLRKLLAKMPLAPFLRLTLAQHFLNRVYWRHWKDVDRSHLLEAAQEVIKAFGSTLRKGQMERWIGKTSKQEE